MYYFRTVAKAWKIRAGSSAHASGGQDVAVSKLVIHPSYDYFDIDYDISLYFLASELLLGSSVAPIPLAKQGQVIPDNSTALISGWGTVSVGFFCTLVLTGIHKMSMLYFRKVDQFPQLSVKSTSIPSIKPNVKRLTAVLDISSPIG